MKAEKGQTGGPVGWRSKKPPSHALAGTCGCFIGSSPCHGPSKPAPSRGEGCNLGDVNGVLKSSTEAAAAAMAASVARCWLLPAAALLCAEPCFLSCNQQIRFCNLPYK